MYKTISRTQRRAGVFLNYFGLTGILVFSFLGHRENWNYINVTAVLLALVIVIITLLRYHIATGLWKLTHSGYENLDERQIQVTHQALSTSYSIFTIICLFIFLGLAVLQSPNINLIITFLVLLYLAHTLPASIIAWRETEV